MATSFTRALNGSGLALALVLACAGPLALAECIAGAPMLLADRAEQMGLLWRAARGSGSA